jgi:sigma-E factor negative regulatory protein RseA
MSEIKSESVSSLVDNFSSSSESGVSTHLVDNLLKDDESLNAWQNYHLIGDVLRDELPQSLQLDLSEQIATAIAQEATILSPNLSSTKTQNVNTDDEITAIVPNLDSGQTDNLSNDNRVVNFSSRIKAKLTPSFKPLGQVAIAASAAVLMIVGVQNNITDDSLVIPNQIIQTVPLSGYANPVSFSVQSPQFEPNIQRKQSLQQAKNDKALDHRLTQQRRLQALLKDHNQQVKLATDIK